MLKKSDIFITISILIIFMMINFMIFKNAESISSRGEISTYSTYDSNPSGCRALMLLFEQLGYSVTRWKKPFSNLQDESAILFCIQPQLLPVESDIISVIKWVEKGNIMVFFSNHEHPITKKFGIKYHYTGNMHEKLVPIMNSPYSLGIKKLVVNSTARITLPDQAHNTLIQDEYGEVAMSVPVGRGSIFFITDPQMACNSHISEEDNVVFLANILLVNKSLKTVLFDEYIHGYFEKRTLYEVLKDSPIGWALFQVSFAVFLLLYARGKRFAKPIPLSSRLKIRETIEYVRSMANIYRMGGARAVALKEIYYGILRDMGRRYGIKAATSAERILEIVKQKNRARYEMLKNILDDSEQAIVADNLTDAQLLSLTKKIALLKKEKV